MIKSLKVFAIYIMKENTKLLSEIHQFLKINPKHADAYSLMAITSLELGEFNQALDSIIESMNLDSNKADTYIIMGIIQARYL